MLLMEIQVSTYNTMYQSINHFMTSVTCFNSVISFCWYYITTSVTCKLLLVLHYNKCYMLQLCYKLLLVLHYNKCYMLQLCYKLLYYIITSVTCFNSVISFWYYIMTSVMIQLCYKLVLQGRF